MILNFEINQQIIERTESNILVNKSKNYVECNFKFKTNEWTGIEKFAIFKDSWGDPYRVHLGDECESTVIVPEAALKGTYFKVSVYGGDRITTDEKTIPLIPSGYTLKVKPPEGSDVDIFVQIWDALDEKVTDITYEDGVMRIYSEKGEVTSFELTTTAHWEDIIDVPETFPPSEHIHTSQDVSDFDSKTGSEVKASFRQLANRIRTN